MSKSVLYVWIGLVVVNVVSWGILPFYFVDVKVQLSTYNPFLSNSIPEEQKSNIFHVVNQDDAVQFQRIIDRIDEWYKIHSCRPLVPCEIGNPTVKAYETYSITETFDLTKVEGLYPYYPDYYIGIVEYKGNNYTIYVSTVDWNKYLGVGLATSFIGSALVALVWVKFGQTKSVTNKQ